MTEMWHGFCFGLGFSFTMCLWMFMDRFMSDLNWRFWQWKKRNFK